jgi:hypothetical protein
MCSIAANVGARTLRDLCVPWKDLSETVLDREAAVLMASVRQEWLRTQHELDSYIKTLATRQPCPPA